MAQQNKDRRLGGSNEQDDESPFTLTAYVVSRSEEIQWGYDTRADAMKAFRECSRTGLTHDTGSKIDWVRLDGRGELSRIAYTEF